MVPQVLVRWSYLPEELCTWEDEVPLRQQFPRAPAWGQAGSKGGGDATALFLLFPPRPLKQLKHQVLLKLMMLKTYS
jgi:hypothetical protein